MALPDDLAQLAARLQGLEQAILQERGARQAAEQLLAQRFDPGVLAQAIRDAVVAGRPTESVLDSRSFTKLSKFSGERRDWKDWSLVFSSYVSSLAPAMHELMEDSVAENDPQYNVNLNV